MRKAYDVAKLKGRCNPYARLRKKAVTTRLGEPYTAERIWRCDALRGIGRSVHSRARASSKAHQRLPSRSNTLQPSSATVLTAVH